tara:strand:- start:7199 stop:8572 length:1374 start_codon:yes stop_codon:yes gene_type:complete
MPLIYTQDLKELVEKGVFPKYLKDTGYEKETPTVGKYYDDLAKEIKRITGSRDLKRWLQKDYVDRIHPSVGKTTEVHKGILDALVSYANDKKGLLFQDHYPSGRNQNQLENAKNTFESIKEINEYEEKISDNYLGKPEFPVNNPAYPASPHYPLEVLGFKRLWIKDESFNPTGTHKDRMAWEVVRFYKKKIEDLKRRDLNLSIITSGAAGIAIQNLLNSFGLPPLRVLVDKRLNQETKDLLDSYGCKIFETDLSSKNSYKLSSSEILESTKNNNGIDVTFGKGHGLELIKNDYYDWLSYEIINQNPEYCIIPYGSGNLMKNILGIANNALKSNFRDGRLLADKDILKNCTFIGATSKKGKQDTIMDKLFMPTHSHSSLNIEDEFPAISKNSRIEEIEDEFVIDAFNVANENCIKCEYSGISGLGLFLKNQHEFDKGKKILIVNTGKTKPFKTEKTEK